MSIKLILVLILSLNLPLFGDSNSSAESVAKRNIWQHIIETQNQFFTYSASVKAILDDNLTQNDVSAKVFKSIDAKAKAFNLIISELKSGSLSKGDNDFFEPSTFNKEIYNLKYRIKSNRKHNYDLAVRRDNIKIKTYELKQKIFLFFTSVSRTWMNEDQKELQNTINEELKSIKSIYIQDFEKKYLTLNDNNSKSAKQLQQNLADLYMQYMFYSEFLNYTDANYNLLHYKSFVEILNLKNIILVVNDNVIAKETNRYLRYIHTDLGRLSLFFTTLLLTYIISIFLYKRVYIIVKNKITKKHNTYDDLLLANIENLRKPFFVITASFGLQIAIEALLYPVQFQAHSLFFYLVYIVTFSYMIVSLIDNLFYHLMLTRTSSSDAQMRSELVNLLLSIVKFTVYLIALLMFLVKLDINITSVLTSLGIGAMAVALAAKDTLSNFFGLVKIIADRSFSQGDWIKVPQAEGTVVEIKFVSTTIRTFDNALITIPNSTLANAPLMNWNRRNTGRRLKMSIGVTYNASRENIILAVEQIREMLINHPDIASTEKLDKELLNSHYSKERKLLSKEDKLGIKTTLLVYLDEFSDSSINILVYAFSKTTAWQNWLDVKQDVLLKIWEILDNNDLEFAFPSQSLYFDKENVNESFNNKFLKDNTQ